MPAEPHPSQALLVNILLPPRVSVKSCLHDAREDFIPKQYGID